MSKFSSRELTLAISGALVTAVLTAAIVIGMSDTHPSARLDESLAKYGYTPALTLLGKDNKPHDERVFIACGKIDVKTCGEPWNIDNEASYDHPLVMTTGDKVTYLEGPHVAGTPYNYWIEVPSNYQDFANLTHDQQGALLGVMPTVAKALGTKLYASGVVQLPIGKVQAFMNK